MGPRKEFCQKDQRGDEANEGSVIKCYMLMDDLMDRE